MIKIRNYSHKEDNFWKFDKKRVGITFFGLNWVDELVMDF